MVVQQLRDEHIILMREYKLDNTKRVISKDRCRNTYPEDLIFQALPMFLQRQGLEFLKPSKEIPVSEGCLFITPSKIQPELGACNGPSRRHQRRLSSSPQRTNRVATLEPSPSSGASVALDVSSPNKGLSSSPIRAGGVVSSTSSEDTSMAVGHFSGNSAPSPSDQGAFPQSPREPQRQGGSLMSFRVHELGGSNPNTFSRGSLLCSGGLANRRAPQQGHHLPSSDSSK